MKCYSPWSAPVRSCRSLVSFRCRLCIPPSDSAPHPAPEGWGIKDEGWNERKEGRAKIMRDREDGARKAVSGGTFTYSTLVWPVSYLAYYADCKYCTVWENGKIKAVEAPLVGYVTVSGAEKKACGSTFKWFIWASWEQWCVVLIKTTRTLYRCYHPWAFLVSFCFSLSAHMQTHTSFSYQTHPCAFA